jgi:hypothetical protein
MPKLVFRYWLSFWADYEIAKFEFGCSTRTAQTMSLRHLCWRDRSDDENLETGIGTKGGILNFFEKNNKEFDKLRFGIGRHKSTGTKVEDHDWVGP